MKPTIDKRVIRTQVTNPNRTGRELQEFFLFAFAVRGKKSRVAEAKINYLLELIEGERERWMEAMCEDPGWNEDAEDKDFAEQTKEFVAWCGPLELLAWLDPAVQLDLLSKPLPEHYKDEYWIINSSGGLGCYKQWAQMIEFFTNAIAFNNVNSFLKTASISTLESIPNIKMKTSRFFVLHSRADARCIPLDTHILRYLRDKGFKSAPDKTPSKARDYEYFEGLAIRQLKMVDKWGSLAEGDLETWKMYSGETTTDEAR